MTKYAYSPHTGELIETDRIESWMETTTKAPPALKTSESAVFTNGAWSVVQTTVTEPVPERVTRAQGIVALKQAGLWDNVQAHAQRLSGTDKVMVETGLQDAPYWRRDSQFLNSVATALSLSGSQVDDLFVAAGAVDF